uniref:Uncharacterized protein n=1 Tax=Ditylenchus dipsaci TaxID=166011 RepID=A0A915CLU2_9BILA
MVILRRRKIPVNTCQLCTNGHLEQELRASYTRATSVIVTGEEGKAQGQLTVTEEKLSEGRKESIYFVVSATNIDINDFLGKCDPFLKIFRINMDNTLQLAYRSRYNRADRIEIQDYPGSYSDPYAAVRIGFEIKDYPRSNPTAEYYPEDQEITDLGRSEVYSQLLGIRTTGKAVFFSDQQRGI